MAIYISGVKGLPEQVQANKEDIEQIKEDIANIDFDAIRELEAQVDENTQDINNLENGQGVQDQAINGLRDRVGTAEGRITQLESDTRKISYNETNDETTIQGTTKIAIIKNNRIGDDDSEIRFGTNQGIVLKQGTHTLNYDDDGKLYLDGVEITPTPVIPPTYRHNIVMSRFGSNTATEAVFVIENNSNTPFTNDMLKAYINGNHDNWTKALPVSGHQSNNIFMFIFAGSETQLTARVFYVTGGVLTTTDINTSYGSTSLVITDTVEEIQ